MSDSPAAHVRAYPPDFCDDDTMAYLLGLAVSTFRQYVNAGVLPAPMKIGSKSRWYRAAIIEALADHNERTRNPSASIMEAARGNGTAKGARRNAA